LTLGRRRHYAFDRQIRHEVAVVRGVVERVAPEDVQPCPLALADVNGLSGGGSVTKQRTAKSRFRIGLSFFESSRLSRPIRDLLLDTTHAAYPQWQAWRIAERQRKRRRHAVLTVKTETCKLQILRPVGFFRIRNARRKPGFPNRNRVHPIRD